MPQETHPLKTAGVPAAKHPYPDPAWAWAPFVPGPERPWTLARAGHLFRRAAFGATWEQLQKALTVGPQATIDHLLQPEGDVDAFNRMHDDYESSAAGSASTEGLRSWWLRRMMDTPHPLLEKMTLFWHSYYAISNADLNDARLMSGHVQQLRRHALGSYAAMLEGILNDPAVYLSLGAQANRKSHPHQYLPRILLKNYTVGPGEFSEEDVREIGRALTGWFVLRQQLRFIPREHDAGIKNILGHEGPLSRRHLIPIFLAQRATARRVTGRLYQWLISETNPPPEPLLAPLTDQFEKNPDIGKLVETMLRSNLFFSEAGYRQRIKGPVEFALGIVRGFSGRVGTTRLGADLAALGQDLYNPPAFQGWVGNQYWINRFTLLRRTRLVQDLLDGQNGYKGNLNAQALAGQHQNPDGTPNLRFLLDLFLQGDLSENVFQTLEQTVSGPDAHGMNPQSWRRLTALVVSMPEFHLS